MTLNQEMQDKLGSVFGAANVEFDVSVGGAAAIVAEAKRKTEATPPTMFDPSDSGVGANELRQFVERIERLEEDKAGIASDVKDVFAELKGRGFDAKAVRRILALRRKDASEREEEEAILKLYMQALGMA